MDASGAAGNGYAAVPVRRKSRKKTVDRKASKGRKIKYVTHPKMQNFMFPQVRFHLIKEIAMAKGLCAGVGYWPQGMLQRPVKLLCAYLYGIVQRSPVLLYG